MKISYYNYKKSINILNTILDILKNIPQKIC